MATTMDALSSTASIAINTYSRAMAATAGFAPAAAKGMLTSGL